MASLQGSGGSVTIPHADITSGTEIDFYSWNAITDAPLEDDDNFSDSDNWGTSVGLMYDLKGTAIGTMQQGQKAILADVGSEGLAPVAGFVLQTESGNTYTFAGLINSINTVVNKTGRVTTTIGFESSGEVTVT